MYPVGGEVPHHFLTLHPSLIFDQSSLKGIKLLHAISRENWNWADIWQPLTVTENQCSETPAGVLRSRTIPRRCPPTRGPRALSTTAHLHTLIKLKCQLPDMELTSGGPSFLRMKGRESRPRQLPACRGSSNPVLRWPPAASCPKVRNTEWAGQGPRPLTWWCSHLPVQASRHSGRMFTCKLFCLRLSLTLCGFHTDGSVPNHGHHTLSCKTEREGRLWSGECLGLAAGENALKGEQAAYLTGEWGWLWLPGGGGHVFFFFGEWVFRGNSLQSWHCPPEGGMYRNRAVEGEGMRECMCVCVCVCVWMQHKRFLPMKPKTECRFFLSCFIEVSIYRKLHISRASQIGQLACQCRRHGRHEFDPWTGKIPWKRAWQSTPVFLPGKSHGQRNLVSYRP